MKRGSRRQASPPARLPNSCPINWSKCRQVRHRVLASEAPAATALANAYHQADYGSAEEAGYAAAVYRKSLEPFLDGFPGRGIAAAGDRHRHRRVPGATAAARLPRNGGHRAIAGGDRRRVARCEILHPRGRVHRRRVRAGQRVVHLLLPDHGACARPPRRGRGRVPHAGARRHDRFDHPRLYRFHQPCCWAPVRRSARHRRASAAFLPGVVALSDGGDGLWPERHRIDPQRVYPLRYWLRLLPLPSGVKRATLATAQAAGIARMPVGFDVGNLLTVARKPV